MGDPQATDPAEDPGVQRLQAEITDLTQRRSNVFVQMEEFTPSGDDDVDRDLRDQLRRRYSDLAKDIKAKAQQLDTLLAAAPEANNDDPSVFDQLPVMVGADLDDLPEALLRALYESFQLQVRYHHDQHAVTLRVTVRDDRIPAMRDAIEQATNPPPPEHGNPDNPGCSHVLSTPNGIPKTWEHHPVAASAGDDSTPPPPGRHAILEARRPLPPRRTP